MIDIKKNLGVRNIHDLVDKEIKGKFKTNNLTDEKHGSELLVKSLCILMKVL